MMTTMPNRYSTFASEAPSIEHMGPVTVRRIKLPGHQSGILDQSFAFSFFAWKVRRATQRHDYDAVFATSSRLATGVLGASIARKFNLPLYLDIRDIFADTLDDVFKGSPLHALLPVVRMAERYALRGAATVNVVSTGFIPYFKARKLNQRFTFFPNGVDEEFLRYNFRKIITSDSPKTILYAGNIGDGQGLHRILPQMAQRIGRNWKFVVVGDGGRRRELEKQIQNVSATNIALLDPMPRNKLMELYRQADVLLLHLNDFEAFKRVLPSKIFEYAASGKPILAGANGHCAEFLKENVVNSAVFPPCDATAACSALASLELGQTLRRDFIEKYSRKAIVKEMIADMLKTVEQRIHFHEQ